MQLSEIKNDLAKILFNPTKNYILLSDFLLMEDENQSLVGQVIGVESSGLDKNLTNVALIKFVLAIDKDANLSTYNGYTPNKNTKIIQIDPDEIAMLLKNFPKTIHLGNLAAHKKTKIDVNIDFLKRKTYVQCDDFENSKIAVSNLIAGLNKLNEKIVVIDFDGRFKGLNAKKIRIAKEFKLPLSCPAFDYMNENDLDDCQSSNKAFIQGILLELQNYVKGLEEGFIPFDSFLSVIDGEYAQNPLPELALFRNKLLNYKTQGLFAQQKEQFCDLNKNIKAGRPLVIDVSGIDEKWHKFVLETIVSSLEDKVYFVVNFEDYNCDKKLMYKIYEQKNLTPIASSGFDCIFALQLKSLSRNFILFTPQQIQKDFAGYTSFLNKLTRSEFIIWGENTLYLPLIIELKRFEDEISPIIQDEIKKDVDAIYSQKPIVVEKAAEPVQVKIEPKENIEEVESLEQRGQDVQIEQTPKDAPKDDFQEPVEFQEPLVKEIEADVSDNILYEDLDFLDELNIVENPIDYGEIDEQELILEPEQEPLDYFSQEGEEDDIEHEIFADDEQGEYEEDALMESILTEPVFEEPDLEEADFEPPIEPVFESSDAPLEETSEDLIFEEDVLELIENVEENEIEIIEEENIAPSVVPPAVPLEVSPYSAVPSARPQSDIAREIQVETQIPKASQSAPAPTPMPAPQQMPPSSVAPASSVPQATPTVREIKKAPPLEVIYTDTPKVEIYDAIISKEPAKISFKEGSFVYHEKYGKGVVEKIISYGDKTLCSIQFDNVGRRLLDPSLAGIKPL